MEYMRKGLEEEVNLVVEEDNYSIVLIKNKKIIGRVYGKGKL